MSTHGLLPGGDDRLFPDALGLFPFEPRHKAIILYFMFFMRQARSHTDCNRKRHALHNYSLIVASTLLKKVHGVHVHPDSIKDYYRDTVATAKAVGRWDQHALAEIISSQVDDEPTLKDITWFRSIAMQVSSHFPIVAHHHSASADWGFKSTVSAWLRDISWTC